MARTGLTNFVAWALSTAIVGFFAVRGLADAFLIASVSLVLAWSTRFWPEALGVAAGVAGVLFWWSLYDPTGLIAAAVVAGATLLVWRYRTGVSGRPAPPPPNGTAKPWRLILATLLAAFTIFVLDFVLALSFGFTCQSDTSHATPGSDRAAWCDTLARGDLGILVLLGPALLVLGIGIYAAARGRAREVLIVVIAAFVLTIGIHIPDFVLSNAAP